MNLQIDYNLFQLKLIFIISENLHNENQEIDNKSIGANQEKNSQKIESEHPHGSDMDLKDMEGIDDLIKFIQEKLAEKN